MPDDEFSPYNVVDVKRAAAELLGERIDDGVTDATSALQVIIDDAPDGAAIYFPEGEYLIGDLYVGPFPFRGRVLEPRFGRSGLTFFGDGHKSILKRRVDAQRIATVLNGTNITFTSLGFDANGIGQSAYGGGLFFHGCSRVRVYDTFAFDRAFSHPDAQPELGRVPYSSFVEIDESMLCDRNAFAFAKTKQIWMCGNIVWDQQVTFAGCSSVIVSNNTLVNPIFRGIKIGFHESPLPVVGYVPVGDALEILPEYRILSFENLGTHDVDYEITGNIITNAWTHAIQIGTGPFSDPHDEGNEQFARIRIAGNLVRKLPEISDEGNPAPPHPYELHAELSAEPSHRSRTYGCGVLAGRGIATSEVDYTLRPVVLNPNSYTDLTIEGNDVSLENPLNRASHGIFLQAAWAHVGQAVVFEEWFERAVVRDNCVRNVSVSDELRSDPLLQVPNLSVVCWGLRSSTVAGNGIFDVDYGILIFGVSRTHVYANRVDAATVAYWFQQSSGDNYLVDNAVIGSPDVPYNAALFAGGGGAAADLLRRL